MTRPRLKILWLVHLDYHMAEAHGGNLRFFNYGKKLVSAGHDVYFLVRKRGSDDPVEKESHLNALKQQKIITDYFEIEYDRPRLRGKLGHLLFHPALTNRFLRKQQGPIIDAIRKIITSKQINLCICTSRDLLFVLPAIRKEVKTIVDWVDSYFLYHLRDARLHLAEYRPDLALNSLRFLADAFIEERYYGRHCAANLSVSSVDKRYLDFVNGNRVKNHILLNGVEPQRTDGVVKIKNQIIFSGNMDFPPNYKSAIWFIDHVFPLLKGRDVRLVIAGANPVKDLVARANEDIEVTGYINDLRHEIARSELYVAPLICGGGFKNKLVEAIASGTFVVATSMAVEFLGSRARNLLLVADTPQQMADAIVAYFQAPQEFAANLEALKKIIDEEFSWENRAREFVEIVCEA